MPDPRHTAAAGTRIGWQCPDRAADLDRARRAQQGRALLELPSNDMWTATAILRTMADIDPRHPTTRSFAAVYWKGGDAAIDRPSIAHNISTRLSFGAVTRPCDTSEVRRARPGDAVI